MAEKKLKTKKDAPKATDKKAKATKKSPRTAPKKAPKKAAGKTKTPAAPTSNEQAVVLSSEVRYDGPLFRVLHEKIVEPGGKENEREIIRHNGSVVILAVDRSQSKRDPWVVLERQYRYAAGQFLWELPAGKLEKGEEPEAGAQRELKEETGYQAKKWKPLVEYFPSPGFLGESMKVFLAEGLIAGQAHPEADEEIDFRLVKLSDVVKRIEKGEIVDGKTLTSILLYARKLEKKGKK